MNDYKTVEINDPLMAFSLSICYSNFSEGYLLIQVRSWQVNEISFQLFS